MSFLSGLSNLVTGASDVAGGYAQGQQRADAVQRAQALETIKLKRQDEQDAIMNSLRQAQTREANARANIGAHLTWKVDRNGELVGLPTTQENNNTPGAGPAASGTSPAQPVEPGPVKNSDQGPATAAPPKPPSVTDADPGPEAPSMGVKSGVMTTVKPSPYSQEAISADSTKAVNRQAARVNNPLPSRSSSTKESPQDKARRVFVAQRMKAYMSPQYDSSSSGILHNPPLSREDAAAKAQADADALYGSSTQKPAPTSAKSEQGHSHQPANITPQERSKLKAGFTVNGVVYPPMTDQQIDQKYGNQ